MKIGDTYIKITFQVNKELGEICIAELSEIGFESFEEYDNYLIGYCKLDDYSQISFSKFIERYNISQAQFLIEKIEAQNWNKLWESNYSPVILKEKVYIRAHFHPPKNYPYEVIITPKMAFGTGHHPTTSMLVEMLLETDLVDKDLLDVGTGTGILSILAEKMGAKKIIGIDIDEWAILNSLENIRLNRCEKIQIMKGCVENFNFNECFDYVIVNINRHTIEGEIEHYFKALKSKGYLLLSGFLEDDSKYLADLLKKHYISFIKSNFKDCWSALIFQKIYGYEKTCK